MTSVAADSTSARTRAPGASLLSCGRPDRRRSRQRPGPARPRLCQRDVDRAQVRQRMRPDVALAPRRPAGCGRPRGPRRTSTRPPLPRRGRSPAGRCSAPGGPSGSAGTSGEADIQGVAARHADCGPGAGDGFSRLGATREQPHAVVGLRGDQGVGADRAPEQYCLVPCSRQPAVPGRGSARPRRLRRPHAPRLPGAGRWPAQLVQDRDRVRVPLAQPGQRQVFLGQLRECLPSFPGPATAWSGQVQPSRLDRRPERAADNVASH